MTIYIDSDYKCHVSNPDGTYTAAETDCFDGKCRQYIEGYRFVHPGGTAGNHGGRICRTVRGDF